MVSAALTALFVRDDETPHDAREDASSRETVALLHYVVTRFDAIEAAAALASDDPARASEGTDPSQRRRCAGAMKLAGGRRSRNSG